MRKNLKRLCSYYKPYMGIFLLDLFFAFLASAIALVIPLVVRYITSNVGSMTQTEAQNQILLIGGVLVVLVLVQFVANFYISDIGHVMGAKIERDMRAEIFAHYQKLSFAFYDEQKTGQLMSRITSDLFDITELLHHGPENIAISLIKIIGAFVILSGISGYLTAAAFILVPFMFTYAYFLNKRMKRAFRQNRVKIAEINAQIEDNLSGIRVVKSFANEEIEKEKFKEGNNGFLAAKKNSYFYMGFFHSGMTAFTTLINVVVIIIGGMLLARKLVVVSDFVAFLLSVIVNL
ncbi:MAG: ABC transporter ATP-binding protein, partial [Lachnospiraceae bacterium]|nr:ABC transporter ATP-binding protein [Lachnospiraceae bacterium]